MVDLVDFAVKAYQGALSEKAMLDITNAVADCVVYQVKGTEHSYAGGLSFYKYTDICGINRLERYGNTCKSAPYLAYIDAIADEWEAPEWVYKEVEPFTISDDFEVPTATAGQKEDGSFYADFENEESLISVGYNLKSYDESNSAWLDLGYSFNVDYDETDGMAAMAFDGNWVGLNGEPVNLDLANETLESVSFNIPIVLQFGDGTTRETRIREQFQYAKMQIMSSSVPHWLTAGGSRSDTGSAMRMVRESLPALSTRSTPWQGTPHGSPIRSTMQRETIGSSARPEMTSRSATTSTWR